MHKEQTLRKASHIAMAAMLVLLVLALVFYKERILFLDASYVLFNIINTGTLAIQENRIGSFITQIVPLIGAKLHLSLKTIMIAYSASFNVFYLSVAAVLVFRLRQYALAILMSLYYVLFVTDTFYWTNNEVHQGIAWMFLMFGVMMYNGSIKAWLRTLLFVVFAALAISSHMIVMMPALFLWAYIFLDKECRHLSNRHYIAYTLVLLLLVAVKYYLSTTQPYDGSKLKLTSNFHLIDIYWRAKDKFGVHFIISCFTKYWVVPLVFIAGAWSLVKDKKWLLLFIVIGACAIYYILMCLTFVTAGYEFRSFHIESEWMALSIIAATPFVFSLLPRIKANHTVLLFSVLFAVRITAIVIASSGFTKRVAFTEAILKKMQYKGINKLALQENSILEKALWFYWALPEESIALSAIKNEKPLRCFFIMPGNNVTQQDIDSKRNLITSYANLEPERINQYYFHTDTTKSYRLMTYEELMK